MLNTETLHRARAVFPVFDRLETELIDQIRTGGEEVAAPSGSCLFRFGDPCEGIGFVIDGKVKVSVSSESGRELVLYRVSPGESCTVTVTCLVNNRPYPAQGIVEEDLSAISVSRSLFNQLVDQSPVFRHFVLEIFSNRVNHLMELINEVAFNKLDQRLAARLLELGPEVNLTHQGLADELGSTREMVSRLLESFADQHLVELGRGRITIIDEDLIRSRFGPR